MTKTTFKVCRKMPQSCTNTSHDHKHWGRDRWTRTFKSIQNQYPKTFRSKNIKEITSDIFILLQTCYKLSPVFSCTTVSFTNIWERRSYRRSLADSCTACQSARLYARRTAPLRHTAMIKTTRVLENAGVGCRLAYLIREQHFKR